MRLTAAALAANQLYTNNNSILIYGPPKSGKSTLAGTAAKMKRIKRIYWVDGENGFGVLLSMGLTEEELAKIILIKIPDTKDTPFFIETILKMLTSKMAVKICELHGRVNCPDCSKLPTYAHEVFDMRSLTKDDLVVIDSGSQLGNSAISAVTLGKDIFYKLMLDDWGNVRKYLTDICGVIQQAQYTNFVMLTQEMLTTGEDKVERIYPLVGSSTFSAEVTKYFGTVVHTHIALGKHAAASSSTYKSNLVTGARNKANIDKDPNPTMDKLLGE